MRAMSSPVFAIAVLDDEEQYRRALARLLRAHDHQVFAFECGGALLAEIHRRRFDCVLLDLHMPGMSGFDVLSALHGDSAAPPVIAITGHDDPDFARRALVLGAFACQRKPVTASTLLATIERACVPRAPVAVAP